MIMRKTFLFWLLATLGISLEANAAELDANYLQGTWVVDQRNCSDTNAEFLIFRESGAAESVRSGKLEAAGFWVVEGDTIDFHAVASPAFFDEKLAHFEGEYFAFRIRVVPFNVKPDSFETVGFLGEQIRTAALSRCKS
jgi:hypothetical protein